MVASRLIVCSLEVHGRRYTIWLHSSPSLKPPKSPSKVRFWVCTFQMKVILGLELAWIFITGL